MSKTTNTAYLLPGEKVEEDGTGNVISAEREYQVITAFAASAVTVLAATDLPAYNAVHPAYSFLRVASRSPVMDSNGIRWVVTVSYKPTTVSSTTQHLVRIEYGTHGIQEDILYNKGTNKPLLDANLKPFEGTIQETVEYPYIKIVKQQQTSSRSNVLTLSGTINDADVTVAGVSIPKHAGRIKIVATENPAEQWPWEITYEVMVRNFKIKNFVNFAGALIADETDIGWDVAIVNKGFYYYDPASTATNNRMSRAMEEILNANSEVVERRPTAGPVPLALDGSLLPEGDDPILIQVQTIKEGSWGALGLNNL